MALTLNGTTGISGVDGSASAPSVVGSDSNTGFSFASDTVVINTAGTERARFDSSGRMLIGKTSGVSALLQVDEGAQVFGAANDGNSSCLTMDYASSTGRIMGHGSSGGTLAFFTNASGSGVTEKMRITSDGAIRSGVTSAIQAEKYSWLRPEGDQNTLAYFHQGATANVSGIIMRHGRGLSGFSGKIISFCRNDGNEVGSVTVGVSSTAFNTSSDYRLKENVTAITDGITRLKTLKPYRFNFKDDTTKPVIDGFFAHEVTAVPEAVTGTKDEVDSDNNPIYQSIDQSKLVPLLTAALQETVAKIETLETKVAALEAA